LSELSKEIAAEDPPRATAIYKLSPPDGMSAFLVAFDSPQPTVSGPSPEALKNLKDSPGGLTRTRQLNAQIAAVHLIHARITQSPPTEPMAIPQIVKAPDDKYTVGYHVLKRQAPDGTFLEDALVKVRPNIKTSIPPLVLTLSTALTAHDVMSIGELMAKPEVVTKDIKTKEERTLRGSLFNIQEVPKVASAILLK